jgi:hypothetical protein
VSFAAITLCVASQRVFVISVYFVTDSVRKLLDTPSYVADRNHILVMISGPLYSVGAEISACCRLC